MMRNAGYGSTMLGDISVKGTWQNMAAAGLAAGAQNPI
jgi:hypothetical protein